MTASAPCSCDDAKTWQLRALRAEAKARSLEAALARHVGIIVDHEAPVSPLREMRGPEGTLGYSGGTDEERQAAINRLDSGSERRPR